MILKVIIKRSFFEDTYNEYLENLKSKVREICHNLKHYQIDSPEDLANKINVFELGLRGTHKDHKSLKLRSGINKYDNSGYSEFYMYDSSLKKCIMDIHLVHELDLYQNRKDFDFSLKYDPSLCQIEVIEPNNLV